MSFAPLLSGREARRSARFGRRRKGAGWTRSWREGRGTEDAPRHPYTDDEKLMRGMISLETHKARAEKETDVQED